MVPKLPKSELDELLFQALRAVYRFERVKVSKFGLSYEGIFLLQFLRRHSQVSMSEVSQEMKIPISTATRVVDRLEKKGFVSRKRDEKDMRIMRLHLEPEGDEVVKEIEMHTYQVLLENLKNFNEHDFKSFVKTALNIGKLLNTSLSE